MQKVSSKDIVKKKKIDFYKYILPKVKTVLDKGNNSILDKTANVLLVNSDNGIKFGPVFGNFKPENSYAKSYKEIVENLALSINPYQLTLEKPNYKTKELQDISLSKKDVDLDVCFEKKIKYDFNPDSILQPIGFKAKIKDINLVGNVSVPWQVDHVLEDKLKATESISVLNDYGFDNYYLTKILSAGNLGLNKRFVSTRQSITAIDDILAKQLLKKIRDYETIDGFYVFENEFLHNRFVIVLLKGNFEYEQFELWPNGSPWYNLGYNREYEGFYGRTKYAESQAGGYYAARLGVVEYLEKIKKQARVLVIREIYDDYSIPVGVWQVRENVRNAFKKTVKIFNSKQEVINYIPKRLLYDTHKYLNESVIFKQNRLSDF